MQAMKPQQPRRLWGLKMRSMTRQKAIWINFWSLFLPCARNASDETAATSAVVRIEETKHDDAGDKKKRKNGSLAQLVQSVCLTSRGSGVRLPQLPQMGNKFFIKQMILFCLVQGMRAMRPQQPRRLWGLKMRSMMRQKTIWMNFWSLFLPCARNASDETAATSAVVRIEDAKHDAAEGKKKRKKGA